MVVPEQSVFEMRQVDFSSRSPSTASLFPSFVLLYFIFSSFPLGKEDDTLFVFRYCPPPGLQPPPLPGTKKEK